MTNFVTIIHDLINFSYKKGFKIVLHSAIEIDLAIVKPSVELRTIDKKLLRYIGAKCI